MSWKPVRGRGVASLPAALSTGGGSSELPERGFVGTGFRLAHEADDGKGRIQGCAYGMREAHARHSLTFTSEYHTYSGKLGFRLTRDMEET
jgi:hypothetical protein